MTVRAYRTQPFQTTHENRLFDDLLHDLNRVWGESAEPVLLLGNFYCQGSEIDAAVLKRDSITVIDFKDYGGTITFSENGRWTAGDIEIKGGNKRNPYLQIRDNKFALLRSLEGVQSWPSRRRPNLGHISGMVMFRGPITFDEVQIPRTIASWLHVVGMDHAVAGLAQIASPQIDLSAEDLDAIARLLAVPAYTPVGSVLKAPTSRDQAAGIATADLPDCLEAPMSRIAEFMRSGERILLVTGMMGTGADILLKAVVRQAQDDGRSCVALAPNRRMASRYRFEADVEADSVYSHMYSGDPRFEKDQIVFDLAVNHDAHTHLYVVGDAHLISDSPYETDVLRYGTGRLLSDLFAFSALGDSRRQLIFIGDPFQLTRGKLDESALSADRVRAISGYQPGTITLDSILPGKENDVFVGNCIAIARQLREELFNRLTITTDDARCVQGPSEWGDTLRDVFRKMPETAKFIAYTHAEVNRVNQQVREYVFGLTGGIAPGDVVHIHNSFSVIVGDELGQTVFVPSDAFAEVLAVDDGVEPLVQRLKGRDKPVVVSFLRARVRLCHDRQEVEFLCLKDYLYAEKPGVDTDTLVALRASAASRFRARTRADRDVARSSDPEAAGEDSEGNDADLGRERARFLLRHDPYVNAARLRFGYALTLHRAQGQRFEAVLADLDTGQGQYNDAHFRWVYTVFTVVGHRLVMFNTPEITPLSKAVWDARFAQFASVKPSNLIPFDPNAAEDTSTPDLDSIPSAELRNLYRYILAVVAPIGIRVALPVHHSHQEVYAFESNDGASCKLRLWYNGRFQVTRIETVAGSRAEFADQVRRILSSGTRFTEPFQQVLYNLLIEKLKRNAVSVESIEHYRLQEVYYLNSSAGEVKLQIHYDSDGFVTRVMPSTYSAPAVLEIVKDTLGL
jgi:hypothetical protein